LKPSSTGCQSAVADLAGALALADPFLQLGIGDAGAADDGDAGAFVVGGDHDQGVGVVLGEALTDGDGVIAFEGVQNPTFGVHVVGLLVNGSGLDHEHEAIGVAVQQVEGSLGHLVEHRLIGPTHVVHDAGAVPAAVNLVEGDVHVREVEQAHEFVRARRHGSERGVVRSVIPTCVLKVLQQVTALVFDPRGHPPASCQFGRQFVVVVVRARGAWPRRDNCSEARTAPAASSVGATGS
jgi:hypothetical protein